MTNQNAAFEQTDKQDRQYTKIVNKDTFYRKFDLIAEF